ncbi:MAG TPA: beta-N-acetylhexosaminidase [Planktothrix sp.]|jgi:beta-N-acetylhexosaminidase
MPAKKDHLKLAGRLILGRIPGTELDEVTRKALTDGTMGGIVLFKQNAETIDQLARLCKDIIETSLHPPIIAVDQEGGAVQRFDHLLTPLPSQMALSSCANKEEFIQQCAQINAKQCKALGINCLLAPVMDVLTNSMNTVIATRSYGSDEERVAELAKVALNAISKEGITPVGKHFPGHGATLEDSHFDLAVNSSDPTAIWKTDLLPFRECLSDLPALLVGHVWLSTVNEDPIPATLSSRIVKRILREYFEYDGVVMTDDMTMKAITQKWGLAEASVLALEAGSDVVLVCAPEPSDTVAVTKHVAEAIKSGRLNEDRLKQSLRRLDKRFGTRLTPATKQELNALKDDVALKQEMTLTASAASVALLTRGIPEVTGVVEPPRGKWLNPLTGGNWLVVVPKHPRYSLDAVHFLRDLSEDNDDVPKTLTFTELRYALDPADEEIAAVAKKCANKNVLFLSYRANHNAGQVKLAAKLKESATEVVNVACETPFDITVLPGFRHSLATFDPSDLAMRGLACVLLGFIEPMGAAPVELDTEAFKTGAV